jgi:HSP20 family molecular chaperone IbpA
MSQEKKQVHDEIQRMQRRMDRLFNDMIPTVRWFTLHQQKIWRPPTDVYETDDSVIVKVEIAGMSESDFSISLSNRNLSVSGTRSDPVCKRAYQQLEIPCGHFRTEVFLPYAIDYDDISATYENGFLTVVLPKVKAHQVQIVEKNAQKGKTE